METMSDLKTEQRQQRSMKRSFVSSSSANNRETFVAHLDPIHFLCQFIWTFQNTLKQYVPPGG